MIMKKDKPLMIPEKLLESRNVGAVSSDRRVIRKEDIKPYVEEDSLNTLIA